MSWRSILAPVKDILRKEIVDNCRICGGAGINDEDKECVCIEQYRTKLRKKLAHIPEFYHKASLKTIDPKLKLYLKKQRIWKAFLHIDKWLGIKKSGLHLYGPSGRGKTWLSCAILQQYIDNSFDGLYLSSFEWVHWRGDIMGGDADEEDRIAYRRKVEMSKILVLDEVGNEHIGPLGQEGYWAREIVSLIRRRLEDNKITVVVSNLSPSKLELRIGNRVKSIIERWCISLCINGPDLSRDKHES